MSPVRATLPLVAAVLLAVVAYSGGDSTDPRTPAALPGLPPPFLGTAVAGGGGVTAAVDAYGDLVDLRASPAGPALIANPHERQVAGSVDSETGIVPRVAIGDGPARPLWRADRVRQRYLPGTNAVRTVARFGAARVVVTQAAAGSGLAMRVAAPSAGTVPSVGVAVEEGVRCRRERRPGRLDLLCGVGGAVPVAFGAVLREAVGADRRWLARARSLGAGAPAWARGMHERSLLVLRALTDRRSGAVAAGARDGWAYVWPRDAGAVALAFAAAGHGAEARSVARFLAALDLEAAARFHGDGDPVPGRAAQGDAPGWTLAAARAAGLRPRAAPLPWRERADYHEGERGDFLGNAIAAGEPGAAGSIDAGFGTDRGLLRREGDPSSGLDSAAAWAVRPFALRELYPAAQLTLRRLADGRTRYGLTPGEGWRGGSDPWSAPTAWVAWGLAGLAVDADGEPGRDRALALALLADLRRSATPAGALPERVDRRTGVPRSTTPLAWSHAFALLALRELWPPASPPGE